jgi:hypothetical protein
MSGQSDVSNSMSGQSGISNSMSGQSGISNSMSGQSGISNGMSGQSSMSNSMSGQTASSYGSTVGSGLPMWVKVGGALVVLAVAGFFILQWIQKTNPNSIGNATPTQVVAATTPQPVDSRSATLGVSTPTQVVAATTPQPVDSRSATLGVSTPTQVMERIPTPIGCYADSQNRALTTYLRHGTFEACKQSAMDKGFKYFGLQNYSGGVSECYASNDLASVQKHGKVENCIPIPGTDKYTGVAWSNYVYGL